MLRVVLKKTGSPDITIFQVRLPTKADDGSNVTSLTGYVPSLVAV